MNLFNKAVVFAFAFSAVSGVAFAAGEAGGAGAAGEPGAAGAAAEPGAAGEAGAAGAATSFEELDKEGTGYISREQAAEVPGLDFDAADADGDGRLDRTEFEAAMQAMPAQPEQPGTQPGGPTSPEPGGR